MDVGENVVAELHGRGTESPIPVELLRKSAIRPREMSVLEFTPHTNLVICKHKLQHCVSHSVHSVLHAG
jgi:hypothetical protein